MATLTPIDLSEATCPFCGAGAVASITRDVETKRVERYLSLDNVQRLLAGEPMVPSENRYEEGRIVMGTTVSVTHRDGTVHVGRPPPDWKWPT